MQSIEPDDPETTVRQARQRYFEHNGLGEGGYEDRWVILRAAGLPVAVFPNSKQRVRSVRLHDIHHVLTGYGTSFVGEAEIGAWELTSGCRDHYAAWVLNIAAVLIGLPLAPRAIWRAARRGRESQNLYGREWDDSLLDRTLGELRSELGIGPAVAIA